MWWGPQHPSVGGGGGATGARPAEVYCKGARAATEYRTGAEECVVGSTTPVRRGGGGATGARPAEVSCKGAGAATEYRTGAEECVVGSTTPVRRGGGELQGRGPRNLTVGRDPSVQDDDQLRLSLRQRSRQPFAEM